MPQLSANEGRDAPDDDSRLLWLGHGDPDTQDQDQGGLRSEWSSEDQGIYTIFHDWPPVRVNITDHERCKSSSVFPEHSNGPYSGISAIERRDGQTGTSVTRGSRIPGVKEPSLHHYRQITKTRVKNPGIGHALWHVGSNTRSRAAASHLLVIPLSSSFSSYVADIAPRLVSLS